MADGDLLMNATATFQFKTVAADAHQSTVKRTTCPAGPPHIPQQMVEDLSVLQQPGCSPRCSLTAELLFVVSPHPSLLLAVWR